MSTVYNVSPDVPPTGELPRAGFWRRFAGNIIDTIVVFIPFPIIGAVLFAVTAGTVQLDSGISSCEQGTAIPQGLNPPPPHDSNYMQVCRFSLLGATTGAVLTVARVTRNQNSTTTVSEGYMLDKDGNPVNGKSIDWIFQLALVAYLIGMFWKTGRTVGCRAMRMKLIDTRNLAAVGVPLGKAIGRYVAMFLGAVPALALLLYGFVTVGHNADALFTPQFFQWFMYAALIGGIWAIVLIVQVARKRDPYYDRMAGTAVVKIQATPPPL
jgi:hypothetical protein